jgi:hypothetical protein
MPAIPCSLRRGLVLAALALTTGVAAPAQARITDPTAISNFDLRFDVGLATPVGAVGGTFALPFRYFGVDLSGGVGATGLNLSVMPKVVPLRWDRHAILVGGGFTIALPHEMAPMGRKRSTWLTAEVAYQRSIFIDNVLYLGLGVTGGSYWGRCQNENETRCPAEEKVLWPTIRVGYGRRY